MCYVILPVPTPHATSLISIATAAIAAAAVVWYMCFGGFSCISSFSHSHAPAASYSPSFELKIFILISAGAEYSMQLMGWMCVCVVFIGFQSKLIYLSRPRWEKESERKMTVTVPVIAVDVVVVGKQNEDLAGPTAYALWQRAMLTVQTAARVNGTPPAAFLQLQSEYGRYLLRWVITSNNRHNLNAPRKPEENWRKEHTTTKYTYNINRRIRRESEKPAIATLRCAAVVTLHLSGYEVFCAPSIHTNIKRTFRFEMTYRRCRIRVQQQNITFSYVKKRGPISIRGQ